MNAEQRVTLRDYSDRELLAIIADLAGATNNSPGTDIPVADLVMRCFGITHEYMNSRKGTKRAEEVVRLLRCGGARLSWMKRYGLVEKGEHKGTWRLTSRGNGLRVGNLRAAVANGIEEADHDMSLALANRIGERLFYADEIESTAMRREILFHIQRRKMYA